jgi:hypothetical protein
MADTGGPDDRPAVNDAPEKSKSSILGQAPF